MKLKSSLLGCLFLAICSLYGQTYTHSLRTNTYQHLRAGLRTYKDSNSILDTVFKTRFQIPYFGKAYSDSIIVWGNSQYAITEFEFDDEGAAFGAELTPRKDGSSFIAQTTEGNSPNRIFKIEWGNLGFLYDTLGFDSVSYQVWFYEGSGIIEYHYGPSSVNNPFSWDGEVGPYVYLVDYDGENTYGLKGNPTAPTSYNSFLSGAGPLTAVPPANSVFRFTPAAGNKVQNPEQPTVKLRNNGNGSLEVESATPVQSLSLYSMDGKCVHQVQGARIQTNQLPAGVYLLQAATDNRKEVIKIVIP
jgi:hypothetical protein